MDVDTMSINLAAKEEDRMIKGTPELVAERREEIVNACEKLYRTTSFKEITLKEIGNEVPFSRPTIYNYFGTKEEIFLALFKREYDRWNCDLTAILDGHDAMEPEELARAVAGSLAKREQLLKLLSMNNFDMEANSRQEMLTAFKSSYGESLRLIRALLRKFCPDMTEEDIRTFLYIFFPFMFGIYPYAAVTEKQRAAMAEAGVDFVYRSVYELAYHCLTRLLGGEAKAKEKGD